MSSSKQKSPWMVAAEKRARKNVRVVKRAIELLQDRALTDLPPHHQLGIHLGLITLANCSPKLVEVRARARWLLHWMLGYLIQAGYTVEEAATEDALTALEAIIVVATAEKHASATRLKFRNGVLLLPDDTRAPDEWQQVHASACTFISALDSQA